MIDFRQLTIKQYTGRPMKIHTVDILKTTKAFSIKFNSKINLNTHIQIHSFPIVVTIAIFLNKCRSAQ